VNHDLWTGKWSLEFGDPTWIGWLITLAYFAAAWLCFRSLKQVPFHSRTGRIWLVLATGMLLLGLNKQLDLQVLLTDVARWIAFRDGWYEQRRPLQAVFAATVLLASVALTYLIWVSARRQSAEIRLSLFGAVALLVFLMVRVATFEHVVDVFPAAFAADFKSLMELGGIACVSVGAWRSHV